MLTRQPNPRTRVEVRKDPREPATSSHVSLTPKSFAAPPPPPWLKWLRPARRRRAALPLLLGAPRRHRWCGRWPRHLHPRRKEPIPAGPVALPPSTPPLPRPAAPRTAMKRALGTPSPPSPRLYCFFSELSSLNKFCTEWLTCVVSGSDEQLAQSIILIPGSSGKAQRSCICQKQ